METTKITAKVYEPLWINFTRDADSLFIRRDPFLDHIIRAETPRLSEEIGKRRLSAKAKRYISARLKSMGGKGTRLPRQVSIVVDKTTAHALNEVVDKANLVRDAFINRLLMLLRSSDALLRYFDLPLHVDDPSLAGLGPMPTSPFNAMKHVRDDPFVYLRAFALENFDCGLYLLPMPPALHGFSCYLEDEVVPGTSEYDKGRKKLDSLLAFEENAFSKKKPGVRL